MNAVPSTSNTAIEYDILFALEKEMADDDSNIMLELIDISLNDSPPRLDSIGQALVESDLRKAEISTHSLKSNTATFGVLGLATFCQRMGIWAKAATR